MACLIAIVFDAYYRKCCELMKHWQHKINNWESRANL